MKDNKMAMCYGPYDIKIENTQISDPGPGEVQIKIMAALTCGTDVKIYRRGYPFLTPPFPIGHEFAGVVTAVGTGVDQSLIGKGVVTSNGAGCQFCFYCMRDQDNLCEGIEGNFEEFVQMGGGFAEYINVHAPIVKQNLQIIPEGVPFELAAMVEPLSVALHGVNMADVQIGDTVVIIGAGPMGLLHTQLCKLRGGYVIILEKNSDRLKKAKEIGADIVINTEGVEDIVSLVKKHANEGRGADKVIEAVGYPETWELAIKLARKGGTVVEYGGCAKGTTITVDTARLHYDELTIKGSYSATAYETEIASKLLIRGIVKIEDYISGEYSLDETKNALNAHMNGLGVKYLIRPNL